jgi:Domain of unknown function (DUF4413)
LNLVVQDELSTIESCVWKIREGVKYLRKSSGRLLKFGEVAITLGVHTHLTLCTNVKTRWNSTHRMLVLVIHYKSVFASYALRDPNFEWVPTDGEWKSAEKVSKILEAFLEATNLFSGNLCPTANLFLVQIFKVKRKITNAYNSDDTFVQKMSEPMYEKFEKYWGEIGLLMSIASTLDPRFKLVSLYWTFERLYPKDELHDRVEVTNKLKSLYTKYSQARMATRAATTSSSNTPNATVVEPNEDDFYAYLKTIGVGQRQNLISRFIWKEFLW